MPKPKFDRVKLDQPLRSGKSQKEVAQVFQVSEAAISKAKKETKPWVVKNVSLESAHRRKRIHECDGIKDETMSVQRLESGDCF